MRKPLPATYQPQQQQQQQYASASSSSVQQLRTAAAVERIVLELFDGKKLVWMVIAEALQRRYELPHVSSAVVLGILQDHGRVKKTVWWD